MPAAALAMSMAASVAAGAVFARTRARPVPLDPNALRDRANGFTSAPTSIGGNNIGRLDDGRWRDLEDATEHS